MLSSAVWWVEPWVATVVSVNLQRPPHRVSVTRAPDDRGSWRSPLVMATGGREWARVRQLILIAGKGAAKATPTRVRLPSTSPAYPENSWTPAGHGLLPSVHICHQEKHRV